MATEDELDELDDDHRSRRSTTTPLPMLLVLDVSGSMKKSGALAALQAGVSHLYDTVREDDLARWSVDLAVVGFAGTAAVVQPFTVPIPDTAPTLEWRLGERPGPEGGGFRLNEGTDLAAALDLGTTLLDRRIRSLPAYFPPVVLLMTDALPQSRSLPDAFIRRQNAAAARCKERAEGRAGAAKWNVVALGVGPEADLDALKAYTADSRPPRRLGAINIEEFFQMFSGSIVQVSQSGRFEESPIDRGLEKLSLS